MGIKLKNSNGNIDLKAPIGGGTIVVPGEDGGYYIPSIDEEGNLTWTPTKEDMEAVEGANIKGADGAPGKDGIDGKDGSDGIYVGTEEPEDSEALIWINPTEGEVTTFATEEYVDNKVSDLASESYVAETIAAQGFQTEAQVKSLINSALEEVENGSY